MDESVKAILYILFGLAGFAFLIIRLGLLSRRARERRAATEAAAGARRDPDAPVQ